MSGAAPPRVETLSPGAPVELRDIEAALLSLRCSVRCEVDEPTDDLPTQPMTRACMSNLIVYCDDTAEADALQAELAELGHVHPARMIVLVADAEGEADAPVAELTTGLSDHALRPQVSSEQIRIHIPGGDAVRMAAAARPLLMGDLPTALWWNATTPPTEAPARFMELVEMASTLVYDSRGWRNPARGLVDMANWILESDRPLVVADLAWMRQRGWRDLFGEVLAPHLLPGVLQRIETIHLEHGPHALPLVALFVGWLAHSLGWSIELAEATSEATLVLRFQSDQGRVDLEIVRRDHGTGDLELARLATHLGAEPIEIQFDAAGADRVAVRVGGGAHAENHVHLPREPRIASLAWQLANRSGDPNFRAALGLARSIAQEVRR